MWNMNFQMIKLVLEKAEEPEIKFPTSTESSKKQESSRKKKIYFCFIDYAKTLVWITINCGKFWKRWKYQTTWPAPWEIYMKVRKQWLEMDMDQQTGSKKEKEHVKSVYCHPAYLTYMQSTSWKMLEEAQTGIKIARRNINNLKYAETTPLWWKWRRTKKPLDECERGEWKSWLKA